MKLKKIFTSLFLVLSLCAISSLSFPDDSEARRFGGRTSIGRTVTPKPSTSGSGSSVTQQRQQTQSQSNLAGGAAATSRTGMFGGLFGGLLAGTLLGSMLSGTGFSGGGFLDILLIGGLIYLAYRFFASRKANNSSQNANYNSGAQNTYRREEYDGQSNNSAWDHLRNTSNSSAQQNTASYNDDYAVPASFDTEGFLSGAKMLYVRMQESWDRRDLEDIRQFTSDAFFREVEKQFQDDPNPSTTELILVQAQIMGVMQQDGQEMASVLFDVKMSEDGNEAEQVKEIWNFGKDLGPEGSWQLQGIQQV